LKFTNKRKNQVKYIVFIFIIITVLLKFDNTYAQEDVKSPFILKELSISTSGADKKGRIHLRVEPIADGDVSFEFHADPKLKVKNETYDRTPSRQTRKSTIEMNLPLNAIEDGFHFVELGMGFKAKDAKKDRVASYQSFPIYFQIKNGEVVEQGDKPNEVFNQPSKVIYDNKPKAIAEFEPITNNSTKSLLNVEQVGSAYRIHVYIHGQVRYQQTSLAYGFSSVYKGMPATTVYLDWDEDNDPTTRYTPPYSSNIEHVGYAKTDMNGNYYFNFYFNSDYPANYYASFIRIEGNAANEATFNGDRGNGAQFVPIDPTQKFSLSGLTDNVVGEVNPTIEANEGSALRHLYRARLFAIDRLGFTPNGIRFYIRHNAPNSWFAADGADGSYGVSTSLPHILFNQIVGTHVGYHEYGHFVEWNKIGYILYDDLPGGHYFELETTDNNAWTEGWAEFYGAATHDYYYSIELPSLLEHETRTGGDAYYEFLDYGQTWITPGYNRNNTKVEGAVASFFYSIYDDVTRRASGYTGDNDDVAIPGFVILNNLWKNSSSAAGSSRIEKFKNGLLYNVITADVQSLNNSINSLYSYIIEQIGKPRSATPTILSINSALRSLSWNDNTCPSSLTYYREGSNSAFPYYPVLNQEEGFKVYRKLVSGFWDGTLNGYSLIATVGANVTSWTDMDYLIGTYSYIVVAYNSSGNSIPKAQAVVTYQEGEIKSNITMSGNINISNSITVFSGATLTVTQGTTITFSNGSSLIVNGTLTANGGTDINKITFDRSGTTGTWGSIKFDGAGASSSVLNNIEVKNATNIQILNNANVTIQNSIIRDCTQGIYIYNASPQILNNQILYPLQHGIYVDASGKIPLILNNKITKSSGQQNYKQYQGIILYNGIVGYIAHNDISGFDCGIYVGGGSNAKFTDYNWQTYSPNNRFTGNRYGIMVGWGSYLAAGVGWAQYWYNSIYNNDNYNIYVYQSSTAYAQYNYWGVGSSKQYFDWNSSLTPLPALSNDPWGSQSAVKAFAPTDIVIHEVQPMPTRAKSTTATKGSLEQIQLAALTNDLGTAKDEDEFMNGIRLEEEGKIDEAIEQLKKVVKNKKYGPYAITELAGIKERYEKENVQTYFEDLLKDPNEVNKSRIKKHLAGFYLSKDEVDRATAIFDELKDNKSSKKDNFEGLYEKFNFLLHIKKDVVSARNLLAEIKDKFGDDEETRMHIATAEMLISGNNNFALGKKQNETTVTNDNEVVKEYALFNNYPNPFNPSTTITYQLPKSGNVTVKIFDILGNEVKTLVNEQQEMGRYTVQFDASSIASGMYVYQLKANDYIATKKMILTK